jgi:hypothetical protein
MQSAGFEKITMENFIIGVTSSIVAGIILAALGKWRGWWWKSKSQSSIDLATEVLKALEGEVDDKTRKMVYATKQLGDSLVSFYKNGTQYNKEREVEALSLIEALLVVVKPLATALAAGNSELDNLKRAVIAYQKGLERRDQIVSHLCDPPNHSAMDAGHVRDQLLSENVLPHDLLDAAKGEAAIFLRGYGINWLARRKYRNKIVKKHRSKFKEAVEKEYRSVLQQTSLHKAKK